MILEIDIGNTRLKWRLREQQVRLDQGFVGTEASLDLLAEQLVTYRDSIRAVFVVSVVGDLLEQKFADWSVAYLALSPEFVRTGKICGVVRNGYSEPSRLGVDRWLAINAAYRQIRGSCVVVSCGTAITVDLLSSDGRHLGGYIAPGFRLMLASLASGARQIALEKLPAELSLAPAGTTTGAVCSAVAAMFKGLIDNAVRELQQCDVDAGYKIIFTGGDMEKLSPFYPQALLNPDLVLDGIACILDYP